MRKNVKNLAQRKQLAALLLGRDVGMRKKEVAALVGVVPQTISRWLTEITFREMIEEESKNNLDDVRAVLDSAAFFAALKSLELLGCGQKHVEARVAADILDRTGYAKTKFLEADITVTQANPLKGASIEQIAEFAEAIARLETYSPEDREWLAGVFPDVGSTVSSGETSLPNRDDGGEA